MKVLISAVGSTDPISKNRDAALLHLARKYRPDKIVLVFSEEMLVKEELVVTALQSIHDYTPIIEKAPTVLKNDDVFLFDKMYDIMGSLISFYQNEEDELILNLSSGTPQITSALFALNRINDYNTEAVQVATPQKGANRPYEELSDSEIQELLDTNEDNQANFEDRCIEDKAEKFNQSLTKRYLRSLITSYDYLAAEAIVSQQGYSNLMTKSNLKKLRRNLNDFVSVFKNQAILPEFQNRDWPEAKKKALNYFLMIKVLKEKANIADVLIKSKSFVEFIFEGKINALKPDLIRYKDGLPKLNLEHVDGQAILTYIDNELKKTHGIEEEELIYNPESTLNLLSFVNILEFYDAYEGIKTYVQPVVQLNGERNKVAHGLAAINSRSISSPKMTVLIDSLKAILCDAYDFQEADLSYYELKNEELLELLTD